MGEFSEDKVRESEQQSPQRELRGEGRGAVRGADHTAPQLREPESEAQARQGPIADEHMREGWGGPDENYATGQGPNDRGQGDSWEQKAFRDGDPPAGRG